MTLDLGQYLVSAASWDPTSLDSGLVWSVALLAALGYAVRSARLSGLDPRKMYWAVTFAVLGGFFGGHLMNLFVHGWQGGPLAVFQFWQGGKSYYGGLIGGGIAGGLFFYYCKVSVFAYADAAMPALALGYAVGRLGCFINGDDYGALTNLPWAVVYPPGTEAYADHLARSWISLGAMSSLPIHPAQLYASLLGLGLFALLANWRPRRIGARLCTYVALYGATRFAMEFLRGDFRAAIGPLSLPQVFSILFVLASIAIWIARNCLDTTAIHPHLPTKFMNPSAGRSGLI
jgi:phosphatidylglycerol:prolipoprotein diacylglycerol transferase